MMERTDPLPVGRYWIMIPLQHAIAFAYWRRQTEFVQDEGAEHNKDNTGWSLHVFRVIKPVKWYAELWGWPNVADQGPIEMWTEPAPPAGTPRARRQARWKLAETMLVGIGTIVIASMLIQKYGRSAKTETP